MNLKTTSAKKWMMGLSALLIAAQLMIALLMAPAAQAQQAAGAVNCTAYHTVASGENLFRIALRYNSSVAALAALNNIANPGRILVGQRLCVSGTTTGPVTPTPNPGQPLPGSYVVQAGDTLSRIAQRFGVSLSALASANNITNPNRIFAGQVLVIPQASTQPAPTVGSLMFVPENAIQRESGAIRIVEPTGLITVTVAAGNASRVEFYSRATGSAGNPTQGTPVLLASDTNGLDGYSVTYRVDGGYRGVIYAVAYGAGNQVARTAEVSIIR